MGILLGRDRVFILLLGSYISFALMGAIPLKKIFPVFFENEENFVVLIVTFLVLIGVIYFLLSRSILKSKKTGSKHLFQIFFLSVFFIGIVASVIFMFFPKDLIKAFSSTVLKIFNTSTARFLWLVIPLIFVGIFKGRKPSVKEKKST